MSKQTRQTNISSLGDAAALLHWFERERNELLDRRAADKRREIAFAAHAGDEKSAKALEGLHEEAANAGEE